MAGPWEKYAAAKPPPASPEGPFPGMLQAGNIDLDKRPIVQNADGSYSTVRSMSFGNDAGETLVPTVSPDGKIMSDQDAMDLYGKTGQTLGVFDTPAHADMYAEALHKAQDQHYGAAAQKAGPWAKYGAEAPAAAPPAVDPEIAKAADAYEKVRGTGAFAAATDAGATGIPFADEMYSAVSALPNAAVSAVQGNGFHPVDEYNRSQALQTELARRREEQHPVASTVGGIVSGIGATAPLSAGGLSFMNGAKPTLMSLGARGAAEGASYGAAYGAGEGSGLEDRAVNASKGMLAGGAVGGLLGGVARIGAGKLAADAIPSTESLKDTAKAAYQAADDAGVIYSGDALKRVADQLKGEFTDFGYHPQLQPGAKVALDEVNRITDGNATLKGIDAARKIAGNAFVPGNKSNNALTSKVVDALDNMVTNPQAGDVIAGDGGAASDALTTARDYWSRASKQERVSRALYGAEQRSNASGSSIDNASRQKVASLLTSKNGMRGFTPDETAAMEQMVKGTTAQNILRVLGKAAPTGIVSGGVGTTAGAALGGAIGGPAGAAVGSVAVPMVGKLAKMSAEALTGRNAAVIDALIRNGGKALPKTALGPARQVILEALARGSAQQLPAYTGR